MQHCVQNTWKGIPSKAGEIVEYEDETWVCWVPDEITRPSREDNVWFIVKQFNKETGVVYIEDIGNHLRYTPYCTGGKCIMFPDPRGTVVNVEKFWKVEDKLCQVSTKLEDIEYHISEINRTIGSQQERL